MYICPRCKKEVQPNAPSCVHCGLPFAVNNNIENEYLQQPNSSEAASNGRKGVPIILIAIIGSAVIIGLIFLIVNLFIFGFMPSETDVSSGSVPVVSSEVSESSSVYDIEDEYMIYGSDRRYIARSELVGLSQWELRVARNEIYARHGRKFDDSALQEYFNSKSWYNGTVAPDKFKEDSLNGYEKANIDLIVEYEKDMGYR